jgi:Undecaprenyl-phosphate glucose phosphotransferase
MMRPDALELARALNRNDATAHGEKPFNPAPLPRGLRLTSNIVGTLHVCMDMMSFFVAAPLSVLAYTLLRQSELVPPVHIFAFCLMLGSFLLIRSSRSAYGRSLLDAGDSYSGVTFDAIISSLIASALVWQAGLIGAYSRGLTILFLLSVVATLALSRPVLKVIVRRLMKSGQIEQRIVFYGSDAQSIELAKQAIEVLDLDHLRMIGVADDRVETDASARKNNDLPMIGDLAKVCELAQRGEVDQVILSGSHFSRDRVAEIVDKLSAVCVDVSLIPAEAISLSPHYRVNLLGSIPVLTLWQRPLRDLDRAAKRAEDIVISAIALALLSPVMIFAALMVRFSSPGPILFVQPRMGFNNEVIFVYKFRTMYVEATDLGAKMTTTRNDCRVTWAGRLLRRLSIDELPQIFNVFRGNMSLVGPRPHAMEMKVGDLYYHEAVQGYAGRHRVKPGMTGLAQVKGLRGEVRTIERAKRRVELDKYYIDHWSIWLDLKVMLATPRAVLFDRDAY